PPDSRLFPYTTLFRSTNLKLLASNLERLRQFTQGGGWVVFHGLTPAGLADYNQLVGHDHMIRPFRRERVTFPPVKSPLMSGLTLDRKSTRLNSSHLGI